VNTEPCGIVVIGMGNPLRRDDGVGWTVARRLERVVPPEVEIRLRRGGLELMDAWDGAAAAMIVDAVSSGSPAGTVLRFDTSDAPLPRDIDTACSTHGLGLHAAVELARAMDRLPDRVLVIGVEGADFTPGNGLSPAVEDAVREAVEAALREIDLLVAQGVAKGGAWHA